MKKMSVAFACGKTHRHCFRRVLCGLLSVFSTIVVVFCCCQKSPKIPKTFSASLRYFLPWFCLVKIACWILEHSLQSSPTHVQHMKTILQINLLSKNGIIPLEAVYYWKTRCRSTEMATLSFIAVSNKYLNPETREIDGQNIQLQTNTLLFSLCLDWLWITASCIFCSFFQITDVVGRSTGCYNLIIIVSVWPREVSGKRLYNLIFRVTLG